MESHKQLLDKEYETLLQQFTKELEKIQIKNQHEKDKKVFLFIIIFCNFLISYNNDIITKY